MMEEEIKMLFRISQPEGWKHRMSTMVSDYDDVGLWDEIGLKCFCDMELDLSLSIPSTVKFSKQVMDREEEILRAKEEAKLESSSDSNPPETDLAFSDEIKINTTGSKCVPNSLYLTNLLRLSIDCPFSDVRKKAADILFSMMVSPSCNNESGFKPKPGVYCLSW